MKTVELSEKNPVVAFIKRVKEATGRKWKPFPSDVCALGRTLLLNILLVSILYGSIGLIVTGIIIFWLTFFGGGPPTEGIIVLFAAIGLIANIALVVMLVYSILTFYSDPIDDKVNRVLFQASEKIEEWSETSALIAMYKSFKDRVCFYVRVREE